ncbi:MAG: glycosyltransferase family 39 protein [Parvularculaceae bacterium]|nr:glycosyltransferase family 39 protein [Parvularculaceae bacterium]
MPPLDRDESRFAQASAQMLETGDFVTIRFQEEERNKKPAGAYWLQSASVAIFSDPEAREIWAYRLPSVLGAILAAVFAYCAIARLFDPRTGFIAAVLLGSAPLFSGEAMIAKTDMLLLAAVTGAAAAMAHLLSAARDNLRENLLLALAFWVAIGAGILIKGPIILLVIVPAAAMIAIRFPHTKPRLSLRPLVGVGVLLLMIGPWAIAINAATDGRFFEEALGADMFAKLGAAQESHAGPPGYHILLAPILAFPLIALMPAGLYAAFKSRRDFGSWFLLSWLIPGWVVFELTATKLPHYVLPMYPALAGIAAVAVFDAQLAPRVLWRAGAVIFFVAGLIMTVAIVLLPFTFSASNSTALNIASAMVLVVMTTTAAVFFWRQEPLKGAALSIVTSLSAVAVLIVGVLPTLTPLAVAPQVAAALDQADLHPLHDGAAPAALAGFYEPSAVFLLGTGTRLGDGAQAADTLLDDGGAAIVEARERTAFDARLTLRGGRAELIAEIKGFNYSKGDHVILSIFRPAEKDARF